jgi:Sec-independent protein translocase protein TatA
MLSNVQFAGIAGLSGQEILVVAGIAVFLFGGKAFAKWGTGMGDAVREWRKASREVQGVEPALKDERTAKS